METTSMKGGFGHKNENDSLLPRGVATDRTEAVLNLAV